MSLGLHQWYRVGFVAVSIFWLSWFFLHAYQDYLLYTDSPAPETSSPQVSIIPAAAIADTNLADFYFMGKPSTVLVNAEPKPEKLLETRLDLELRGVFDSRGPMLSGAVIESGSNKPGFFQVGDLIAETVTLAAIEGQTVIIDRDGKLEKLSFDKSLLKVDSFSRTKNQSYIKPISEQHLGIAQQVQAVPINQSLEERLALLRSKHRPKD